MRRIVLLIALALMATACGGSGADDSTVSDLSLAGTGAVDPEVDAAVDTAVTATPLLRPTSNRTPAPEFPDNLEWLNTDRPLVLEQLAGKIVVLDFWTYGCINCIHVIPEFKRLEAEFPDELVVIGVHSAKFEQEASTENIRQIILRYGVDHPVVNDHNFDIWQAYGVGAWPTVFAIDPGGGVVGYHSGEDVYGVLQPVIAGLLAEFGDSIDRTPLRLKLEREGLPETVLSFPGKVTADAVGRLFISDTNHNRIVQTDLAGTVQAVFGTGEPGYTDGEAATATLNQPQGTVLSADGTTLYVADTENHVVRVIDLSNGAISTLAGTGRKGWPPRAGPALSTDLNSPWAVELGDGVLYIAMAGTHQIWALELDADSIGPYAGSSREGTLNGPGAAAELAQPSGVSLAADGRLFFTDSESSAIRWVDTTSSDRVVGISAGSDVDLFSFGDQDGIATASLLQHPLGVVVVGSTVYFTDTYNSKVKSIDLGTNEVVTRWGGVSGWRDGSDPLFYEPGGIDELNGVLYIADTNNHSIRTIDLVTGEVGTLVLSGIERFMPAAGTTQYRGEILELESVTVGAGPASVLVDIVLPDGYKVNNEAPSSFIWSVDGGTVVMAPDASGTRIDPSFPLEFGATFVEGTGVLTGDLSIVYCDVLAESICLIEQIRVTVPMSVIASGTDRITVIHEVILPDF